MKYTPTDLPVELQQLALAQADEILNPLLLRLTIEVDDVHERHAVAYAALLGAVVKLLRLEKARREPCQLAEFQPLFDQLWQLVRDERRKIRNLKTGELN